MKKMMKQKHQKKDTYLQKKDNKLMMNSGQYNNIIMEYQKITNLLNIASNEPSKFRTKNWVEINDESKESYNANSDIRFNVFFDQPINSDLKTYENIRRIATGQG